jgi:hypothetical protein
MFFFGVRICSVFGGYMDKASVDETLRSMQDFVWDGQRFSPKAQEELRALQKAAKLPRKNPEGHWLNWYMQVVGKRVVAHPEFIPALEGQAGWVGPLHVESLELGEFSESAVPFVDFSRLLEEGCAIGDIKLGFESEVKAWREKLRDRLLELVPKN